MRSAPASALGVGLAALLLPVARLAAEPAGSSVGLGAGARALALAGATVSAGDGALSAFWNPAYLASLDGAEIAFAHRDLGSGFGLESASAALRPWADRPFTLEFGGHLLSRAGVAAADALGGFSGTPGAAEYLASAHAAYALRPNLLFGAGFGRLATGLGDAGRGTGWSSDVGLLVGSGSTHFGVSGRGLAASWKDRAGSHPARPVWSAGLAQTLGAGALCVAVQVDRESGADPSWAAGAEWRPARALALRSGTRFAAGQGKSQQIWGAGLGLGRQLLRFDYGVQLSAGNTPQHAVSIHLGFGRRDLESRPDETAPRSVPPSKPRVATARTPATAKPPVDRPSATEDEAPPPPVFGTQALQLGQVDPILPEPRPLRREAPATPAPAASKVDPPKVQVAEKPASGLGRFVVRAGLFEDIDSAAVEIMRLYRGELHPTLERRGSWYVVVVRRCQSRAEAGDWQARAKAAGVHCSVDEE
jgi:hypothetical protein